MFNRITAKSGQVPLDSKCKSLMKLYCIYCDFLIVYFLCVVSNYDHECHFSKLLHHRTLFAFANFNSVSDGQIKILKLIIRFNELTKKKRIKNLKKIKSQFVSSWIRAKITEKHIWRYLLMLWLWSYLGKICNKPETKSRIRWILSFTNSRNDTYYYIATFSGKQNASFVTILRTEFTAVQFVQIYKRTVYCAWLTMGQFS